MSAFTNKLKRAFLCAVCCGFESTSISFLNHSCAVSAGCAQSCFENKNYEQCSKRQCMPFGIRYTHMRMSMCTHSHIHTCIRTHARTHARTHNLPVSLVPISFLLI